MNAALLCRALIGARRLRRFNVRGREACGFLEALVLSNDEAA